MSKKKNEFLVVQEFCTNMTHEIASRFGENASIKDIMYHLTERGIAKPIEVRNYQMLKDFDRLIVLNGGKCMDAFSNLSIKYEITERQVQTIIYSNRSKFSKKSTIK
tara:strand:- start:5890 stop:6210 length:321 start_codon:yes stop_codon:yes gene_type:complete